MSRVTDLLRLQDAEVVRNSFYRHPKVTPNIEKYSDHIVVKTIDNSCELYKLEEVILYIIADFKFAPVWLVQQWFDIYHRNDYFQSILDWIEVGLVWTETTSMGVYVRPTKFLLDLFQIENDNYIAVPFGLLNHTVSEEQMIFDLHMGNKKSEMWQIIKEKELLPVYHPLGITCNGEVGTLALRETHFRLNRYDTKELVSRDREIMSEIESGAKFTTEFSDFTAFPIVSVYGKKVIVQTPDVIIPLPRKDGKAQSFAIEIELSPKTKQKYEQIMQNYKDNIKFGTLLYFCGTARIAKMVRDAFDVVGGLGSCELYLLPYTPPAMQLSNYSISDEEEQGKLLLKTGEMIQ